MPAFPWNSNFLLGKIPNILKSSILFSKLCVFSRHRKVCKSSKNRLLSSENSRFFGPSGEIRTRGILVPNRPFNFFLIFSNGFWWVLLREQMLSTTLASTVSGCSGAVYGQGCGQNRFTQNRNAAHKLARKALA